jgi:hypothetical protein
VSCPRSARVERGAQPFDRTGFDTHDVEPAGRLLRQAHQVMPGREYDASLFDGPDARRRAAERAARSLPHLHKHQRSRRIAHDEVDFAATAPRRPIIARQQLETGGREMRERAILGGVTGLLGAGGCDFPARDFH